MNHTTKGSSQIFNVGPFHKGVISNVEKNYRGIILHQCWTILQRDHPTSMLNHTIKRSSHLNVKAYYKGIITHQCWATLQRDHPTSKLKHTTKGSSNINVEPHYKGIIPHQCWTILQRDHPTSMLNHTTKGSSHINVEPYYKVIISHQKKGGVVGLRQQETYLICISTLIFCYDP